MALLVLMMVAAACKGGGVAKTRGLSRAQYPDQESWDSQVVLTRDGRYVARTISDKLVKFDNTDMAFLSGNVGAHFYNDDGQHISYLTSDSASVNLAGNHMSAFGHVVVISDSGHTLATDTLLWEDRYEMITTDDTVRFTTPQSDTLFGVGFQSDVDLTNWTIFQPWGVTGSALETENE